MRSLCGEDEVGAEGSNEVMQLPVTSSSSTSTGAGIEAFIADVDHAPVDNVLASVTDDNTGSTCAVQECIEFAELVQCEECQLQFCSALHGPHRNHSCQQLKPGYSFKGTWEEPYATVIDDPESCEGVNIFGIKRTQTPSVNILLQPTTSETTAIEFDNIAINQ